MKNIADFIRFSWKFEGKTLSLQRVFHSIRFKVNKVGIQWYPIFFVLFAEKRCDIRSFYPFLRTFLLEDNHSNLEKIIILYHICEKIAPNFRRTFGELRKSL